MHRDALAFVNRFSHLDNTYTIFVCDPDALANQFSCACPLTGDLRYAARATFASIVHEIVHGAKADFSLVGEYYGAEKCRSISDTLIAPLNADNYAWQAQSTGCCL